MFKKCLFNLALLLFVFTVHAQTVSIEPTVNAASLSFGVANTSTSRVAYTWLLSSDVTLPQSSTVLLQQSKACVKYSSTEPLTTSVISNLEKKTGYVLAYITIDALGNPTSGMYTTNFTTPSEPVIYYFNANVAYKTANLSITCDRVGKVYLLASVSDPSAETVISKGTYAGDITSAGTVTSLTNVLIPSIPSDISGTPFFIYAVVVNADGSQSMFAISDLFLVSSENNEIRDNKVSLLPNPASSTSTISYALNESTNVIIEIYDMSGKYIKSISNDLQTAGTYQKTFDVSDLVSGAYVCRLRTTKNTVSRTLVIKR